MNSAYVQIVRLFARTLHSYFADAIKVSTIEYHICSWQKTLFRCLDHCYICQSDSKVLMANKELSISTYTVINVFSKTREKKIVDIFCCVVVRLVSSEHKYIAEYFFVLYGSLFNVFGANDNIGIQNTTWTIACSICTFKLQNNELQSFRWWAWLVLDSRCRMMPSTILMFENFVNLPQKFTKWKERRWINEIWLAWMRKCRKM